MYTWPARYDAVPMPTWTPSPAVTVEGGPNMKAEKADKVPYVRPMNFTQKCGEITYEGHMRTLMAADDMVQEWPQSGERLTKANSMKLLESYGEMSGTSPTFKYGGMLGGGDVFVIKGTIDYGDGIPVSYVGVGELRDGKVAKMTEYFANPFEAPAWRADFVEKMEPAGV